MNQELSIPNQETRQKLVRNLCQTRLDLQDFGLQLEELLAGVEKEIRVQKLKRLEQYKQNLPISSR
ncbi:MAG: hypothetical protein AB4058_10775 [Microcystaceae cyanobacterium]